MWHVYKYNLLSLLEAIQIMGFILHPTQMAATESGQEGRRLERKHMKLYRQDLKGKDRQKRIVQKTAGFFIISSFKAR